MTTTDASTFMPAESARPPSEIRFRCIPETFMRMKARIMLRGISIAAVTTLRNEPMKTSRITTARNAPMATSWKTFLIEERMNSLGSTRTRYRTSPGKPGRADSIAVMSSSDIRFTLPPGFGLAKRIRLGAPLVLNERLPVDTGPKSIRAMSERCTFPFADSMGSLPRASSPVICEGIWICSERVPWVSEPPL